MFRRFVTTDCSHKRLKIMFFNGRAIGASIIEPLIPFLIGYRVGFGALDKLRAMSAGLPNQASPKTNHNEPNCKSRKYYDWDFELTGSVAIRGRVICIAGNGNWI
jgi:hypothetical protein